MMVWLAASIVAIYLPFLNETPVRYSLAIPALLFIPGYCLIAALFPKNDEIDLLERIMLSIGLSIAIVPLIGLGLNFTPWGIRLEPIVIALIIFTLLMIIVAYLRRAFLPSEERFRVPFLAIAGRIRRELLPPEESGFDRFLSIILILVILIVIITTVYVIVSPKEGERFSEFFILGEKQMAYNYPDQIIAGLDYPMFVGVGNHEYRNVTYTIETWFLRTEFDTVTNTSHIITMDPGEQLALILAHNETRIIPYNLSVRKTGYDRVEFLLFNETVPGLEVTGSDRINASYRDLHLRITVV
ncbi:MAG: DUF1616 domain-containing protein [Methanoregula sp.]|nr:DUF1616 domain-containing protein [Methanoregula sp.]